MKGRPTTLVGSLLVMVLTMLAASASVHAEEYDVLKDAKSVEAVFDIRAGSPKSVAMLLDLILQTYRGENIRKVPGEPEFVMVFLGPSVKLISTQTEGFTPEEKEMLAKIANTVSEMSENGIGLEICLVAANMFGIDPATFLPEIKQVDNGLISLIGYQGKGYSLVPIY